MVPADGTIQRAKVAELFLTKHLERVPVEEARQGDLVAVAGFEDITIGETLADADDPRPLPVITVDEPALSMTIGINTSPLAGRDGSKLTARQVKNRLEAELVGNVSIRMSPTDRPDAWEVQARGELQLAVLVETMRREGFELTVGKPEVVTREIDGAVCEPVERVTIDVPEEHLGVVTQLFATRKARMKDMVNHGHGWVRLDYLVPARGLIGFRTEFLTETRGTGVLSHIFNGYEPWAGEIRARATGSLVADRSGPTTTYAMVNLQDRSTMMVGPGTDVYCGMIVGENSRAGDMDVNICREKKLTNMRASSSDNTVNLTPHRVLSLEHALEYIAGDECIEVTPKHIRLRKVELDPLDRVRAARRSSPRPHRCRRAEPASWGSGPIDDRVFGVVQVDQVVVVVVEPVTSQPRSPIRQRSQRFPLTSMPDAPRSAMQPLSPSRTALPVTCACAAGVDVDGPHRVRERVADHVGRLGPHQMDAPPAGHDGVAAHGRADRVGDPDRAQMVADLAALDDVTGAADDLDADVPSHPRQTTA